MRPPRNVPVVTTIDPQANRSSRVSTPRIRPPSTINRAASPARMVRFSVAPSSACITRRYWARSIWARGPRTAGPLARFRSRNWMVARSASRPMTPSSASISRTRWPLPRPPMAGLQDITPIDWGSWVSSAVRAPMRAEAAAASQPACPPPTTITSKLRMLRLNRTGHESSPFHVKHIICRYRTG